MNLDLKPEPGPCDKNACSSSFIKVGFGLVAGEVQANEHPYFKLMFSLILECICLSICSFPCLSSGFTNHA